ncbi:hypothetical protein TNCV_728451 [Trichonephila clavipes]|nr:hypothetical protein TNCV_728451 [Trichonephila clavipes]
MWNVTDWQKVVFSDESLFVLGTDDNRVRVWKRPGERYWRAFGVGFAETLHQPAYTPGIAPSDCSGCCKALLMEINYEIVQRAEEEYFVVKTEHFLPMGLG